MADSDNLVQEKLDTAMPWVGLYIAAASTICTLAMAADTYNGFRLKKLWFPCKYFSLNAISLTLLAVAMKLPMDLNTIMIHSAVDLFPKLSSLIFMSIAMGNFMSSLGSMNNKEIQANVVALSILVVTVVANVRIQLVELQHILGYPLLILFLVPTLLLQFLLATIISLAIMIPTTKRRLELMYQEQHKSALMEEEVLKKRKAFAVDDQRGYMMKYWVMAETSSPQFVMARSVVCTTSAVICLIAAIILAGTYILLFTGRCESVSIGLGPPDSAYGWYTIWILLIQSIGVVVGIVAPMLRWLVVVSFKYSTTHKNSFRKEFKIEAHWIEALVDWRENSSALHIQRNKYRKYLHNAKWFAITFCIGLQTLTVGLSKLLVFLSVSLISPFFFCITHMKNMISNNQIGHESRDDNDLNNLSRYVLLLEGEAELPVLVFKDICLQADDMIQRGRMKQPEDLVDLLHRFVDFNGVGLFDSNRIPSLHSQEPLNCWALPLVTLTSIVVALPNIAWHKGKLVMSSVSEGLFLVNIVEKTLDKKNAQLVNIRKAANITWVGLVAYMKWLEIDLRRTSVKCKNSREVLQELSSKAEGIIMEFKKEVKDSIRENPLNWPSKIVAANSMYRISRTLLLSCEDEDEQMDEGLFERLYVMIADILAACLTNLPHVISTMCHRNAIEKREKSVRKAFLLLGETEQIVELLQQQEWPSLDRDKAASIEEWRAFFQKNRDDAATSSSPSTSTSSDETVTVAPVSSAEHLAISVDC